MTPVGSVAGSAPSIVITPEISPLDRLTAVQNSKTLTEQERRLCTQMIQAVAAFGINYDEGLFNAADYCFDVNFGENHLHNIISIGDYLQVMGEPVNPTLGENDYISADFFAHDRPGFFLINRDGTLYFLKEGNDESLVYYDFQKDAFVDSSSLPVEDGTKVVILNKSATPPLDTYYDIHTPAQPVKGRFYHESQNGRKCGVHAAHAFLGFPIINETQLSLMKLEQIVELEHSQLAMQHKSSNLPMFNMPAYRNTIRFKLAQTSLYQTDLGNNMDHLAMVLKQMATSGIIDRKYINTHGYEIHISGKEVEYAAKKGFGVDSQIWWEADFLQKVLGMVTADLEKDKDIIDNLDRQIKEIRDQKVDLDRFHPKYGRFIELLLAREPYDILEGTKRRLKLSIDSIKTLQRELATTDRLLVCSDTEDHCFTLRKIGDNDWAIIDSLVSDQPHTNDPLKFLIDRMKSFSLVKGHCLYSFGTVR